MHEGMKAFQAPDGENVFYRHWTGQDDGDVLVYLHGIESHTGWFVDTAESFNQRGFSVYALERRGSGVNERNRGHVESYMVFVRDLRKVIELAREENPKSKVYIMGLCWGGKLAVTFSALYQHLIDGLILAAPGIKTRVDLKASQKLDVFFSNMFRPRKLFKVPIEDEMFTKNPKYLNFIKTDRFKLTRVTARFFFETARMDMRADNLVKKIKVPIFLLLAGEDRVINNPEVKNWFEHSASKDKTVKVYSGSCHSLEFEDEAKDLVKDISKWINDRKN